MKNKLILLSSALVALASCGTPASSSASSPIASSSEEKTPYVLDLNVACPKGAPAVSLYRHLGQPESKLDINADATNIAAYMTSASDRDICILPTNAGLTAIAKKNAPFKIAATITFGNFFLASTGHDANGQLDPSDCVVYFQKSQVPGKIFDYVYGNLGLTNLHDVEAASDAKACLETGKLTLEDKTELDVDYVFIAEPALTATKAAHPNVSEFQNVQTKWAEVSGNKQLTQASVFVANSADKSKVNAFLSSLEEDINSFVADPSVIDPFVSAIGEDIVKNRFLSPSAMIKNVTKNGNRMGLGFKKAKDNKEAILEFVKLFGITALNESVYFE